MKITNKHRKELRKLYNSWKKMSDAAKKFGPRGVNIHEAISESAFALAMGSPRVLDVDNGSSSYDNINLKTKKRIQVKATSVKCDLTSFGPNSEYDELYWLDFYRDGKFDGKFDIYKIKNSLIDNAMVNKKQTVKDVQKTGKRPRLSIRKKIIEPFKIKKIKTAKI